MKKIFLALTIALTMIGGLVEAADITDEQFKKIVQDVGATKIESHFHMNADAFRTRFNWYIVPIVQDGVGKDDVDDLIKLFVLKDYDVSDAADGKVYLGRFEYHGAAVALLGMTDDDHLKTLNLYYLTPEKKGDAVITSWLLTAFVGSISTEIDARELLGELTAEGSGGSVVKDGFKFSIAEDGNLNVLTATMAK